MKVEAQSSVPAELQASLLEHPLILQKLLSAKGGGAFIHPLTFDWIWCSGNAEWWFTHFSKDIDAQLALQLKQVKSPANLEGIPLLFDLVSYREPVAATAYAFADAYLVLFEQSPMSLLHFGQSSDGLTNEMLLVSEFNEFSTELICVASEDGYLKLVNKAWSRLLGWSAEELTSKPWFEFVHPDDLKQTTEASTLLLNDQRLASFENRYRCKDGSYKWLGWTAYFYPEKLLVYAVARDISTQKQTEARLQRSDRIVQFATDLLCIAGFDGYLKVVNPAWTEILGWTEAELLAKPWETLLHPDDLAMTKQNKDSNKKGLVVDSYENRFLCKDGTYKWLSWNTHPYPAEGIMYSVARDITVAKHAQEAADKANDRLKKLGNMVPGVVYQYLLRADGTSCFPYASDGLQAIYGVHPEEVQHDASKVFERLHPDDLERVRDEIFASAKELSIFHSRFRVRFPDGTVSWRKCDARPERLADGSTLWYGIITDISHEVAMQTQLQLSERKLTHMQKLLRYVIEHASSAVVVFDLEMRYLFASERFKREYGLEGRELEGLNHFEVFPDLPYHIQEAHRRANRGELMSQPEDHFVHMDGSITYTQWECRPWYDELGKIGGHILYLEITTERKEAEMALKRSNNYLAGLINHANAPIITWDPSFKITRFNHAFERFSGYSADEVLGRPLSILFLSDALNDSLRKVKAASEGKSWESVEIQIRCKDGQSRVALWNSANIYAEDGKTLLETIAQGQDITERIHAEQELQAAFDKMQLLQHALDQVPVYVYMKDLESKYFYANQLAMGLLGLSAKELIGKPDEAFFPEKSAKELRQIDLKVFAGEQSIEQIHIPDAKGDMKSYIEVKTPIIDPHGQGKVVGLLGFSTDITETVQNMRRIEALLKVEGAQNERLRNFTHIVSHNLRSHIANMLGIINLIDLEEPAMAQSTYIQTIRDSADHLNDTIKHLNEVLDINLKEAHDMQTLDLNHTVHQTIHSVGQLAKNAGVKIINDLKQPWKVMGLPAYLDSLVLNMLTNAIKFRDEAKQAEVKISAKKDGEQLVLSFADNGVGVDLERHGAKMFGMYKTFHGHPDSKGLGLFITKNQVEAMGGKIWVESEVGKGTTFFVSLPLATKAAE